jgi:hypothetical protein
VATVYVYFLLSVMGNHYTSLLITLKYFCVHNTSCSTRLANIIQQNGGAGSKIPTVTISGRPPPQGAARSGTIATITRGSQPSNNPGNPGNPGHNGGGPGQGNQQGQPRGGLSALRCSYNVQDLVFQRPKVELKIFGSMCNRKITHDTWC